MHRKTANEHTACTIQPFVLCLLLTLFAVPAFSQAGHLHEMYYNNASWVDTDLTSVTGGGSPPYYGALTAFITTPNKQIHVYYVDYNSQHVHQTYYNNTSWSDSDLSAMTGGPAASFYGISGFSIGNLQYIFYESTDSHVHELNYNNINWTDYDLTSLAGSTLAGFGPVLGFATKPNNQLHVYYQDTNLDLHQLYFNGSSWSDSDLTAMLGAQCYTSWLAGFASGNLQHVFCPGYGTYSNNLHMLHIFYNNSTWTYEDVTYKAGGLEPPSNLGSAVAAFQIPKTNQFEVYGVSDDGHVHQFTRNKTWSDLDLTASMGAPTDTQFGGAVAFPTTPNNQFHVYYHPSTELYQLYFNGTAWSWQDLTGGGGNANDNSGVAGFAIGNLQHVYYIAN
jgi:hypothetical protein